MQTTTMIPYSKIYNIENGSYTLTKDWTVGFLHPDEVKHELYYDMNDDGDDVEIVLNDKNTALKKSLFFAKASANEFLKKSKEEIESYKMSPNEVDYFNNLLSNFEISYENSEVIRKIRSRMEKNQQQFSRVAFVFDSILEPKFDLNLPVNEWEGKEDEDGAILGGVRLVHHIVRLNAVVFKNYFVVMQHIKNLEDLIGNKRMFANFYDNSAVSWKQGEASRKSPYELYMEKERQQVHIPHEEEDLFKPLKESIDSTKDVLSKLEENVNSLSNLNGLVDFSVISKILFEKGNDGRNATNWIEAIKASLENLGSNIEARLRHAMAIAEHNFNILKINPESVDKIRKGVVLEEIQEITSISELYDYLNEQPYLFWQSKASMEGYTEFQEGFMSRLPNFLSRQKYTKYSLWNLLNIDQYFAKFDKFHLTDKNGNKIYKPLLDHQVILSSIFACMVGPRTLQQSWKPENGFDPRLLILSPTGTGKSDIYYQTIMNLYNNNLGQTIIVFVKRSTHLQQFTNFLTSSSMLVSNNISSHEVQLLLQSRDNIDALQARCKSLRGDIKSSIKSLDNILEETLLDDDIKLGRVNFVNYDNRGLIEGDKKILKAIQEDDCIFVFDEIDETFECLHKYKDMTADTYAEKKTHFLNQRPVREEKLVAFYTSIKQYIDILSCSLNEGGYNVNVISDNEAIKLFFTNLKARNDELHTPGLDTNDKKVHEIKANIRSKIAFNPDSRTSKLTSRLASMKSTALNFLGRDVKISVYKQFDNLLNFLKGKNYFEKYLDEEGILQTRVSTITFEDETCSNVRVQEIVVNFMEKYLYYEHFQLLKFLNEYEVASQPCVGELFSILINHVESSSRSKGIVGLTATYGNKKTMLDMFTLFRRGLVGDDSEGTLAKNKINEILQKLLPQDLKDLDKTIVEKCGLETYNFTNIKNALENVKLNKYLFEDLMKLVNCLAMYKPENDGAQHDSPFGKMFPLVQTHQIEGDEEEYTTRLETVKIELSDYNLQSLGISTTKQEQAEATLQSIKTPLSKKIVKITQDQALIQSRRLSFPNKVLVITKGSTVKNSLLKELENIVGQQAVEVYGGNFKEDIKKFEDDTNFAQKIMVATLNEGGRGVDYKNVRTLIKIGYFTYDENTQVNGRVNRLNSITIKSSEEAEKVTIYFLLPVPLSAKSDLQYFMNSEALTSTRDRKIQTDKITNPVLFNCYAHVYQFLMIQTLYYNKFMRELTNSTFVTYFLEDRLRLPNIDYSLPSEVPDWIVKD